MQFPQRFPQVATPKLAKKQHGKGLDVSKNCRFFKALPEDYLAKGRGKAQIALGPRKIRTGKKSMALNNSNTP